MPELTHFDDAGASRMVDISEKEATDRVAIASGLVKMRAETLARILDRSLVKGDVLEVARIAGIMAAKRTGDLIPLCHPISLESVQIQFTTLDSSTLRIDSVVKTRGRTGVEMEALAAVSVAALTVYDMCKAIDRGIVIDAIQLEQKRGGVHGTYSRGPNAPSGSDSG